MRARHCAVALALTLMPLAAHAAAEVDLIQGPYLLADAKTGEVIEDFDALRPWFPASTTKLMTIYVTFEAIRAGEMSLDQEIRYGPNAAAEPPSKMGFKPGTTLTLDNALKMMMVKSANDIAVAVAEAVGGSIDGFARRMNAAAKKLGMTRSHFVNPNGLPDERQVTSARDMALVARALLTEFPEYRSYYAIPAIQIGGRVLRNYNRLIGRYPGATGMKTGFICASGYNLVASAKRDGRELIAVVFGAYGSKLRNTRAAELLDAGFATAATEPTAQERPAEASVQLGQAEAQPVEAKLNLHTLTSGASYQKPLDMRPYVCGKKRKAALKALKQAAGDEEEEDVPSTYRSKPLDLGPPIKVSAHVPIDFGEPGFIARLPKPRPGSQAAEPAVLDAFAPIDEGASGSAPAEAIGTAAGRAHPLDEVKAQ